MGAGVGGAVVAMTAVAGNANAVAVDGGRIAATAESGKAGRMRNAVAASMAKEVRL